MIITVVVASGFIAVNAPVVWASAKLELVDKFCYLGDMLSVDGDADATATLFITTSPSLRSPGSNRSRTLLCVLLSELPNQVTSLPSFGLCIG